VRTPCRAFPRSLNHARDDVPFNEYDPLLNREARISHIFTCKDRNCDYLIHDPNTAPYRSVPWRSQRIYHSEAATGLYALFSLPVGCCEYILHRPLFDGFLNKVTHKGTMLKERSWSNSAKNSESDDK